MNTSAYDLLLLLLDLAQQKSAHRVRETFVDAVSALFAPAVIRWLEPDEEFDGETITVAGRGREYGRIAVEPAEGSAAGEKLPLLHNAVSMLAVILEKVEIDRLLADEKLLLQEQVDARTVELSKANMDLTQEIEERKRVEKALRESEERLDLAIMGTNLGMWDWNLKTGDVKYSEQWIRMLGYELDELEHKFATWESLIHPEDKPGVVRVLNRHFEDDDVEFNVVFRLKTKTGDWRWINSRGRVFARDEEHQPLRMVGTHIDITERKEAEEEKVLLEDQLHQSQKMEAVGRLAGGVAHDFNNILTGIIGFAELSQATLGPGDPIHADLDEIRKAADRAAGLTAQLLAFSRKQIINPLVIQPNDALQNSQKMLERIIGEDIEFAFNPSRGLWRIRADAGQLDQILFNLAVNARDAMPDGGSLTIETMNVTLSKAKCRTLDGVEPGEYVLLTVSDSGQGMDADVLEHIFEPFYSTKGKDHGTGLGLSTVYGIMKQNSGFISVQTRPGAGSTFKIYFPAVMDEADILIPQDVITSATGTESILLVEDEEMVRLLAKKILKKYGYKVIDMDNGGLAMIWAEKNDEQVDLLLTDVIMPGMNGRELLEKLQVKRPEIKTLYMSGYTEDVIAHHGILKHGTQFIQKPFTVVSLTRKVRDVLDL